jgi:nitroreductase
MDDQPIDEQTAVTVERVIRTRRTSLLVDPDRPVDPGMVQRLIGSAIWAPNHKRTWPWRFTVLTGDSRRRLGEAFSQVGAELGMDPIKVEKQRTKYLRSPVVLLVWVGGSTDPVRRREDRDATAAAVQNLLLAATANGLASYWASISDDFYPVAREMAGLDDTHDLVALVYLGHPRGEAAVPARPVPDVTWLS